MEFNEQLITQLTRIEDKLDKLNEQEDALKQGVLTINKPDRPNDMSDDRYEEWVKDCELRAWVDSLSDDQINYLNGRVKSMIMLLLAPKIGPLSKEESALLRDYF
ncbi:hypothetical protein [Lysinibacillus sp. NPDC059133]|uniref:hypothetical protein n=1 Tax=Lysinibacillus sp. NPDC059133 TaxID=3346737 RepID=UPI00369FE446